MLRNTGDARVNMDAADLEQIETKIAFLERANAELSDVVYRQQQELQALRAQILRLAERLDAAHTEEATHPAAEERPPHY